MKAEIDRQIDFLAARAVNLVSREELQEKLERAAKERRALRVKYGADPSAPDIHLGHVVGLNKLREFQDFGHTVVFIIGDFTGMIGDPSGQSATRKPLTREQIQANARTYQDQVFRILDPARTEVRFNSEWCAGMSFEDVLKLSAHVTVAQILARDDFQKRFAENNPISLVEFLYPLIQGYDSVMVNADIELGGTDQLFNLLVGRDLQKAYGQAPQVALTLPLLEGLDGVRKMSKSLGNYVGINEPAREMFGKLMSIPDALMGRYDALVLGRPQAEIDAARQAVETGARHPRQAKDELARRIVARFHGAAAALAASEEFTRVFSEHKLPDTIPAVTIPITQRKNGKLWIVSLLVSAGLAKSNGAARRLIQQGAVKVGDEKISDVQAEREIPDGCVIQAGKRGFARIHLV
ncbi:MAG: tyrosine--tRNA ligase [Verrucomicrobia bacterium]|nr:tyrosine--tRNA ligase [Verrucomicrobiota bacterium]MCG2681745.1 tyrosine--tRNA ligase [Kiritimatiellia bacterium]MBU4247159.1 tyrosine--tRNA ligase [Verrucomicrobiota bacterium]MBU4291063.1 tyrosine--tRNA ligase [Verrucomicrobiota bacterium]MBU4429718.1 tyrosine--tRNA ligase [Verrucomicrobiota bacterium]